MSRAGWLAIAAAGGLAAAPGAVASQDSTARAPTVLFDSPTPLEIRIETDLRTVLRDIGNERDEHPGQFTYTDEFSGAEVTLDIQLRTRGRFRRDPNICEFPPLRLNLRKSQVVGTEFENQDRLKLVTHCQTRIKAEYEQYVLLEYLAYRILNELTDASFRARLAYITYQDTARGDDPIRRFGAILEAEDELARRLGGRVIETIGFHPTEADSTLMPIVDVFQYFIGNTDWGVASLQNIVLIERGTQYLPVPYDFDHAGMISARYARPNAMLGIRRVRDRLYRGYCRADGALAPTFALFQEHREAIYGHVESLPWLDDRNRQRVIDYFDEFYETIEDERRIHREFREQCRETEN